MANEFSNKQQASIADELSAKAKFLHKNGAELDYLRLKDERDALDDFRLKITSANIDNTDPLLKKIDEADGILIDLQIKRGAEQYAGSGSLVIRLRDVLESAAQLLKLSGLMIATQAFYHN